MHNCIVLLLGVLLVLSVFLPFTVPARNRVLTGKTFRPETYQMFGDINGDLMITDKDVYYMQTFYIMQYNHDEKLDSFLQSLGMTAETAVKRMDFNQDGTADNEDIAIMLMYLSGDDYDTITFEQFCQNMTKTG